MREYKFRGKSKQYGHFCYGNLINYVYLKKIVTESELEVPVEDETVTEFTGLTDKKNIEMYEGDVIKCKLNGKDEYEIRVVCYDLNQAKYKSVPLSTYHSNAGNGGWTGFDLYRTDCEVIGNIFDNPELLIG